MSVSKDGGNIDAITAATISSRAFLEAINRAFKALDSDVEWDCTSGATAMEPLDCVQNDSVEFNIEEMIGGECNEE